jgi:hypothetical protein
VRHHNSRLQGSARVDLSSPVPLLVICCDCTSSNIEETLDVSSSCHKAALWNRILSARSFPDFSGTVFEKGGKGRRNGGTLGFLNAYLVGVYHYGVQMRSTQWQRPRLCAGVPRRHSAEVSATLPGIDLAGDAHSVDEPRFSCDHVGVPCQMNTGAGLLIVPTSQHSVRDLVRVGEEIEAEKDELLEKVSAPHERLTVHI